MGRRGSRRDDVSANTSPTRLAYGVRVKRERWLGALDVMQRLSPSRERWDGVSVGVMTLVRIRGQRT